MVPNALEADPAKVGTGYAGPQAEVGRWVSMSTESPDCELGVAPVESMHERLDFERQDKSPVEDIGQMYPIPFGTWGHPEQLQARISNADVCVCDLESKLE